MTPQRRLLLALSLTLAILLAWSAIFPPPQLPGPQPQQVSEQKPLPQTQERLPASPPKEESQRLSLGNFEFVAEKRGGGIQGLKVGGVPILAESKPGFLHLEQAPGEPIDLSSSKEDREIRSSGLLKDGLSVARVIRQDVRHNYILVIKLQISNNTNGRQTATLQMAAHRPLYFKKNGPEGQYQEGFAFIHGKRHSLQVREGIRRDLPGAPSWVAAQGKSLALILKPSSPAGMFHVEHSIAGSPVGWLTLPEATLEPGEKKEWDFLLYAGPIRLSDLRQAGLEEALTFGFFSGIAKLLLELLNWSQGWLRSYGLAILFLSFLIWLVFFPMTWSGIRMMRAMGELQPHVERLRREHAKNPQRMNRELLELYKKHRVNPLSGCLPLILQMPIFVALYQVLTRCAELNGARFLWIQDLSAPDAALRFPSEIPLVGQSLNLLPLLMAAAMFVQQRMTKSSQAAVTEEQQMQQKIFQYFPILFGFLFYGLPSGLVLYWLTNTCLSIGQQLLLVRVHSSKK